jgi:hypothetical protein
MSDSQASVSVTLSFGFLWNVKKLLLAAIDDFKPDDVFTQILTQGQNWYTAHAPAAYILATTSLEAFVNERFFALADVLGAKYPVLDLDLEDELERLDLRTKVRLLPSIAAMKPLARGAQPYQDMATLVKIRNDLVHYKMGLRIPPYVRDLQQRGIALERKETALFAWTDAISTVEGIRWAHNTACAVIRALAAEFHRAPELRAKEDEFTVIVPDGWITSQLRTRRGIDLTK